MTEPRLLRVARPVLARAHLADDDRIDRFQVRRVGLQRQMHLWPAISTSVEVPRWYFTSPEPCTSSGLKLSPPNSLNSAVSGFLTMLTSVFSRPRCGMPMATSTTPCGSGCLDHRVQRGNGDFAAFQAEALGGDVALLAERLEAFGLGQVPQDGALFVGVEEGQPGRALDPALDPGFLVGILDVHELDADRAAIGLAQDLHDLPQGRGFAAEHVVDEDRPVHVGFGEAVGFRVELGVRGGDLQAERVEPGFEVAAHAVGADQHQRAQGRDGGGADLIARARPAACAGSGAAVSGSLKLGRGAQEAPVASSSTARASSFIAPNRSAKLGSTEAGSVAHRA